MTTFPRGEVARPRTSPPVGGYESFPHTIGPNEAAHPADTNTPSRHGPPIPGGGVHSGRATAPASALRHMSRRATV